MSTHNYKLMTEKIKDKMTNLLIAALFALLSIITGGIGYFIVHGDQVDDEQTKAINQNSSSIQDLNNAAKNLIDAYNIKSGKDAEQDREILELWKSTTRSGGKTKLTTELK